MPVLTLVQALGLRRVLQSNGRKTEEKKQYTPKTNIKGEE